MLYNMLSYRRQRKSILLGSSLAIFLIVLTLYHSPLAPSTTAFLASAGRTSSQHHSQLLNSQAAFWRSLYQITLNNDPKCLKSPEIVVPTKLDIDYADDHVHNRPDILWMEESDVARMKSAHSNFVSDVRAGTVELVYNKSTRGIVTTASESQMPPLLVSLRMLRRSGSILPVEVVFSESSDTTRHVCADILPNLSATCVYLRDVFVAAKTGVSISSYQHKIFAILFSSFDELLFLDADAWPAANPDPLFDLEPFTDTGLVVWPDFWYASESPYFFSVAGIKNIPSLKERASTEAGILMYAKSKHEHSILLATYYNYYGPTYYYPLQSQGAPGQGDKETFALAALALGETFYAVKSRVAAIGRGDSNGEWYGSAMVQHDPYIDHRNQKALKMIAPRVDIHTKSNTPDPALATSLPPIADDDDYLSPDIISPSATSTPSHHTVTTSPTLSPSESIHSQRVPLFIHANHPKFDPRTIFENADAPPRDSNGTFVRCWTANPEAAIERFQYDIEARFWAVIQKVACEDLVNLKGEKGDDRSGRERERAVCEDVRRYTREVFGGALEVESQGAG